MIRRTGIRLPEADREGILQAFRDRLAAGVELGDNRQDAFGGNILTQREIAERFHTSVGTVTRMAIDYENRKRAGVDPDTI